MIFNGLIPVTRCKDLGNGVRGIVGFVAITQPYRDTEVVLLQQAAATLAKDGIEWRVGDDRCLYRSIYGAVKPTTEEES